MRSSASPYSACGEVPFRGIVLKTLRGRRRSRGNEGWPRLETQGNVIQRFAPFRLRLGNLLSNRIKILRGRARSRGDEGCLRLETQGNAIQRLALFNLGLGSLLSNRVKKFSESGGEAGATKNSSD